MHASTWINCLRTDKKWIYFPKVKVRSGRSVDMYMTAFLRTGAENDYRPDIKLLLEFIKLHDSNICPQVCQRVNICLYLVNLIRSQAFYSPEPGIGEKKAHRVLPVSQ